MQTALIFGLSERDIQQLKSLLDEGFHPNRPDWKIAFFPAPQRKNTIASGSITQFLKTAEDQPNVHVMGFHAPTKDREKSTLADQIRPYFRFRWLDNEWITVVSAGEGQLFLNSLEPIFDEEEYWEQHIKPTDVSSPLCLPEKSFSSHESAELWQHSERFGDLSSLMGVPRQIERFRAAHHRTEGDDIFWKDDARRRFVYNGPRHGEAPFPRYWKLSLRLAPGFHYDVSHIGGGAFRIRTADSEVPAFVRDYINIDCHGYPRG